MKSGLYSCNGMSPPPFRGALHRLARCNGSCYVAEYSESSLVINHVNRRKILGYRLRSDFITARPKYDRCAVVRALQQEEIRYDRRG
jgi:hypothetical protein